MRLRSKHNDTDEGVAPVAEVPEQGVDLRRLRESVGSMLDAGNAAIERALSSDSESFLRAGRQQGGE